MEKQIMVIKSGRGGARQGSGRKPLPDEQKKQTYSTKLRPDQIEWLRSQKKAASILERLIDNKIQEEKNEMGQNIIRRCL
jgi:hypothetical protein